MKILMLANHLLNPMVATGGDKIFFEQCRYWARFGEEVSVMLPSISAEVSKEMSPSAVYLISDSKIDRYELYSRRVFWILFAYFHRAIEACRIIKNIQTDIVYTTGDFFCNTLPAIYLIRKKPEVKWIANIYHINEAPIRRGGTPHLRGMVSFFLQRFSFFLIKKYADKAFLLNNGIKEQLIMNGFSGDKLCVTGGGLNFKEIVSCSSNDGTRYFDACFLGRIGPSKGIFDLPKIWQSVVGKLPKAKLVIIGSGSDSCVEKLKEQIRNMKLEENMNVTGFLPDGQVRNIMKSAKVFVSASYEEGWGIAVAEAMACKLPVVAYDLPVYTEIFSNSIVKVPIGDVKEFSQCVVKLLGDERLRTSIAEEGYKLVSQYDWECVARKQLDCLRSLQ